MLFHEESEIEVIINHVKSAVSNPGNKNPLIAQNGKVYAEIEWFPESDEGVAGLMVEYKIPPRNHREEFEEIDFFPDGDFDLAIITLYYSHQAALDQEKYELMLKAVREKDTDTVFYEQRSDGAKLYIKYDHKINSWVFNDDDNGYKFEPGLEEAARHFMRFTS